MQVSSEIRHKDSFICFCLMMNGQLYGAAIVPKGMICYNRPDRKPRQPGLCCSWPLCVMVSPGFWVELLWNEEKSNTS